jgi:hypothetical protein
MPAEPFPFPSEEAVRNALDRVLHSDEFRASKRSQEFLRYVVDARLGGHADSLKERTIGIEVFGRSADYDPTEDATVRVKAGEVRKRLVLYYSNHGLRDPVRIEVRPGSYAPEFRFAEEPVAPTPALEREVLVVAERPPASAAPEPKPRAGLRTAVVVGLVCLTTIGFLLFRSKPSSGAMDQFWGPVLNGTSPISLCVAYVPVWSLDREPTPADPPRAEEFVPLRDQFVGGGDLVATSRLTAMLTRMKRPFFLRVGNDVSFSDLRAAPAILVGYSYTRWREISSEMRYFIDGSRRPIVITDNGKPTTWALPNLPLDRRTNEDYAIVSRVFHPDTHAIIVELAGMTQYGTNAAADLVTNADELAEALHDAPKDWRTQNLQLVLHVKVISGAPSSPKLVGAYFWK